MNYTLEKLSFVDFKKIKISLGQKSLPVVVILSMVLSISTPLMLYPSTAIAADATFTAVITPTTVAGSSTQSYTLTITNSVSNTPGNKAKSSTVTVPVGFTSVNSINVTGPTTPWTATLNSGVIELHKGTSGADVDPGSILVLTFNATAPALTGPYQWTTTVCKDDTIPCPGNKTFVIAGSQPTVTVVNPITTTTAVNCVSNPITYGASASCTATVVRGSGTSTPTGTVNFTSSGTGNFTPAANCTLSGSGGTSTCAVTYTPTTVGTGSHTITGTYGGDSIFSGSNGNQVLTVNKRPITVTADAKSKTYGDLDPALTYQITTGSLVGTDTLSGSLTRVSGENVGTYAINQGTLDNSNYAITYVGANLTITQKAVTVTADSKSKIIGNSDPALTYQITSGSLVGSDSFSGSLTRVAGEDVGTYAIQQGTLTLGGNYNLSYVGANLVITDKIVINVIADAKSKTYGDADPELTYTFSPALNGGDSFSGSLSRTAGENVGTYAIQQGTLSLSSDYVINFTGANLTINQKSITITAVTDTKVYDGTTTSAGVPTISPALVLGNTPNFTQTFNTKNVGTGKTLTPAGNVNDGNGGNNYVYTFVPVSTGTITARPITVTAVTDTKVFDGTTSSTGVPTITSGSLATGDTATWIETFDTPVVGTGKTLTPAGTVTDGNSGNNYTVTFVTNTTGVITATPPTTAKLTVIKHVVNGFGGTKTAGDFTMTFTGQDNFTGSETGTVFLSLTPGTYTIGEVVQSGYVATISGDCNTSGSITLVAGNDKTCTITNTQGHVLTYTAGPNGLISGTSPQTVADGASGTAVTAVANSGFHFVNWSDTSTVNPRTDTNVTADISVTANFAADQTSSGGGGGGGGTSHNFTNSYIITASTANTNGSITPVGATTVSSGNSQTYAMTPASGYVVSNVFVDGVSVGPVTLYTFANVLSNHTIFADFAVAPQVAGVSTEPTTPPPSGPAGGTSQGSSSIGEGGANTSTETPPTTTENPAPSTEVLGTQDQTAAVTNSAGGNAFLHWLGANWWWLLILLIILALIYWYYRSRRPQNPPPQV